MPSITNATSFRRRVGASSIIGLLTLVLIGGLIDPTDPDMTNAQQLRAAAAHPGALRAAAVLMLIAAVLAPVATATLVHVVRRRGVVLAHVGGLIGMIGAAGMAAISVHQLFVLGLTNEGVSQGAAVLKHLDHVALGIVMPFIVAMPLALLVLAGAAVRARLAPRWVLAFAFAFWAIDFAPSFTGSEALQAAFGLVAFGWIARRILRSSDTDWETGNYASLAPAGRIEPLSAAA